MSHELNKHAKTFEWAKHSSKFLVVAPYCVVAFHPVVAYATVKRYAINKRCGVNVAAESCDVVNKLLGVFVKFNKCTIIVWLSSCSGFFQMYFLLMAVFDSLGKQFSQSQGTFHLPWMHRTAWPTVCCSLACLFCPRLVNDKDRPCVWACCWVERGASSSNKARNFDFFLLEVNIVGVVEEQIKRKIRKMWRSSFVLA